MMSEGHSPSRTGCCGKFAGYTPHILPAQLALSPYCN